MMHSLVGVSFLPDAHIMYSQEGRNAAHMQGTSEREAIKGYI